VKLVRDRIPQIIEGGGGSCEYYIADPDEFKQRLCDKMTEELNEFIVDPCVQEAADMLEVLFALVALIGADFEDVLEAAHDKFEKRGGFKNRIVLEKVNESE
jgi:predicted house-cleaning noncanonical NTP pyrophosphatase (MazG superfamily)